MSNRIKNNLKNLVGQTLNQYYSKVKPTISDLRYKQEYQNRIIECMVGEVDDNYITTPETDNPIVKLEHSKEGLVKVPSIKGKTILVDSDGNETDTPGEGCRLVSVGEEEDNKLIILSKNKNLFDGIWQNEVKGVYAYYRFGEGTYTITLKDKDLTKLEGNTVALGTCNLDGSGINWLLSGTSVYERKRVVTDKKLIFRMPTEEGFELLQEIFDIQIEKGNIQTEFVPHKSHKTEILLKEPLREGDYIEGKKIYRNVKQDGLTLIPLEEPIIEELPNSITLQGFDDTTMYIENSITPTVSYGYNALIPYKEELRTQKEEVETNTLDIENNIIPYLMDMEYNLMLMEDN